MTENIYDVIAWGRVVVQGEEFLLLSPKPFDSEMEDGNTKRSRWQLTHTLKWEVAQTNKEMMVIDDKHVYVYERSIIVFGSDALLEFYQDPKTIKVKYVIPDELDDDNVAISPTN